MRSLTTEEANEEERHYRDVILQIKQGRKKIYVLNKKVIDKVQNIFENLEINKKDFYWEITNNNKPFPKKKGRPKKEVEYE